MVDIRKRRGIFITFEGVEGSGKSTQIDLLAGFLNENGYEVIRTREPGGTPIGDKIRKIVLNPDFSEMDFKTEALLYAANRAQHIEEVIKPALAEGKVILSDRYVDSSFAYQSYGRGLDKKKIETLNNWATDDLKADLTILLNIPADEGLRRTESSLADRIEQEDIGFHDRVSKGFLKIAKKFPQRIKIIDATRDVDQIHQEIVKIVQELL